MQVCFLAPEHLCLTAGEQGQHKPNVLWKGPQQNNGKSEKWGCGSLPDPYRGRQFDFQRCLTSVASLKRKRKKGGGGGEEQIYTDAEVGISVSYFLSATSLAHSRLTYSFFTGIRFPCPVIPGSNHCWGHCWKWPRSLYQRLWRKAAVKAAWWKLTEERSSKMKNISICFFTFQNDVRISHRWGIPVHWLTARYCQNSNCQCCLLTTGED